MNLKREVKNIRFIQRFIVLIHEPQKSFKMNSIHEIYTPAYVLIRKSQVYFYDVKRESFSFLAKVHLNFMILWRNKH